MGVEGVEQGAGFGEDVFGFGGGERPAEGAVGRELGSAFGVAADQLHEGAGVDGLVGFVGEAGRVGVDVGEFDVEHFDEGLGFLRADALLDLGALAVDLGDADLFAAEAELTGGEKVEDGFGWGAVAVLQLGTDVGEGGLVFGSGDALVHAEALVLFGDVVGVDADADAEIEDGVGVGWLVLLALHLADGLFEHGGVHLEADGFDVSGLLAAEHVACSSEFEVEGSDLEACAEV